ncbi:MAG: DUF4830 domain-containing protein [Oscillospiraceae bacterium]|jgi:hypothetical protein|nr:DUF4830 domain-containing protein [Oscillospiraceae bacterium]MCI9587188.1 DUF4830 domain-containing protein [Oscillospiraceae bacterium]
MFIVSAKFSPRKAIAAVVACAAVLILMILLISSLKGRPSPGEELITAASEEERAEYLRSLGWEIETSPMETLEFMLPQPLNDSYEEYNALQKEQGFDLEPYAGMQVKRYSYRVLNYPNYPDDVQADLYLCGDVVIGGDILYCGDSGFVATLVFP